VYVCEFLKNRDETGSFRGLERNLYVIKVLRAEIACSKKKEFDHIWRTEQTEKEFSPNIFRSKLAL
jgi:hypothetical protein